MALASKQALMLVVALATTVGVGVAAVGSTGGTLGAVTETGTQGIDAEADAALSLGASAETVRDSGSTSVVVETTVRNEGSESERAGVVTLQLREDRGGDVAVTREREVTIPPSNSTVVSFSVPAEKLGPGTWQYTVSAGSEGTAASANGRVTVAPRTYSVDSDVFVRPVDDDESGVAADEPSQQLSEPESDSPDGVVPGGDVSVVATIGNDGDLDGEPQVRLFVDRDRDGTFDDSEAVTTEYPTVPAGDDNRVRLNVPTEGMDPGTYDYRLVVADRSVEGSFTLLEPASFGVESTGEPADVVRGETAYLDVRVRNVGEVVGEQTLTVTGHNETFTRNVSLEGGEAVTLSFDVDTDDYARGNYSYEAAAGNDTAAVELRVRNEYFEMLSHSLRGPDSVTVGDPITISARMKNYGDANGTQSVRLVMDLDDDDVPEEYNVTTTVTLAPGEETRVTFEDITRETLSAASNRTLSENDMLGTHIYGIASEDTAATGVLVVENQPTYSSSSGGSDSSDGTDDTDIERVSRDEITQEKYGLDYDEVSGETKRQIDEVYERQPFAEGLVVTDVKTREEIARERYDVDIDPWETFEFTALDIEVQQQVEADFDAQFRTDSGDRVESWDEISRAEYGAAYESLSEENQSDVRQRYRDQFDEWHGDSEGSE